MNISTGFKILSVLLLFLFSYSLSYGQSNKLNTLNTVIEKLEGPHKNEQIKKYTSMEEACGSWFVSCNKKNQVIGLDFQFADLNGIIPDEIVELTNLEWVNLEYNYLKGSIPKNFSKLKNLEELLLTGNFISDPLPDDLSKMGRNTIIDLGKNSIKTFPKQYQKKWNITNQINLQGCRDPAKIFIKAKEDSDENKSNEIEVGEITTENEGAKVVEEMPLFPGCEEKELPHAEMKKCADGLLLRYIYTNLIYPQKARENGVEGMAVVRFVISTKGEIVEAEIFRDPGVGLGKASLWVVNRMNYLCAPWTPGKQDGKSVKVQYTLPVKFKLEG